MVVINVTIKHSEIIFQGAIIKGGKTYYYLFLRDVSDSDDD